LSWLGGLLGLIWWMFTAHAKPPELAAQLARKMVKDRKNFDARRSFERYFNRLGERRQYTQYVSNALWSLAYA